MTTQSTTLPCHLCGELFEALAACAVCGAPTCETCIRFLIAGTPCPNAAPKLVKTVETLVSTREVFYGEDLDEPEDTYERDVEGEYRDRKYDEYADELAMRRGGH